MKPPILATLLAALLVPTVASAACRAESPVDLGDAPGQWLGDCPAGSADGLGVLRAGWEEPYAFFAGRMRHGRPVEGLLMLADGGWMVASGFDTQLRTLIGSGLHPEQDDRVYAAARAAALATAARFRRAGNVGSANYYTRLAQRIVDGRPE